MTVTELLRKNISTFGTTLVVPGSTPREPSCGYDRLDSQIEWYDSKSGAAQKYYKRVKTAEFIASALVPMLALIDGRVTAGVGVLAVVLEGLQQLNQWQHNWITYRSTCEALRHEKYSYLERSGPYDNMTDQEAKKSLVERVEALISTEHSKWISYQESEAARLKARAAAQISSKEQDNG